MFSGRAGIVAFPTDTVYGLGACANIPQAVERIYEPQVKRICPTSLFLTKASNETNGFAEGSDSMSLVMFTSESRWKASHST